MMHVKKRIIFLIMSFCGLSVTSASSSLRELDIPQLQPLLVLSNHNTIAPYLAKQIDEEEVYRVLEVESLFMDGHSQFAAEKALLFNRNQRFYRPFIEIAGSYFYSRGEYEQAYELVKYWRQLNPDSPIVASYYALLLGETGRYKELLNVLKQNIEKASQEDIEQVLVDNADTLEVLKDKKVALRLFAQSIESIPYQQVLVHLLYADFASRADELDIAWREVFKAISIDPTSEMAVSRVLSLAQGDKRQEGMAFVEKFIHTHPVERVLYLSYINELSKDNNYKKAVREVKRMQMQTPEDFELLYFQALIHYDAKQWEEARKVLFQFIAIQQQRQNDLPKESSTAESMLLDARKLMVNVYKAEKKYKQALQQLERIEGDDIDANVLVEKAILLSKINHTKKALDVLEQGMAKFPDDRGSFLWTGGNILNDAGRTDQAISYYNDALTELPDNVDIKYALALLYNKRGDVWPAEKLLREVIEAEPSVADGFNALGYIFVERNYNLDQAKELLERAMVLSPNNPYILDSMGWLYFRLKDYSVALDYLERAFKLDGQAVIAIHLAEVYSVVGETKQAMSIIDKALANNKQDKTLREMKKRLRSK